MFHMCCSNVINDFLNDASTTIFLLVTLMIILWANRFINKLSYFVYLTCLIFTRLYIHPLGVLIFLIGLSLITFA